MKKKKYSHFYFLFFILFLAVFIANSFSFSEKAILKIDLTSSSIEDNKAFSKNGDYDFNPLYYASLRKAGEIYFRHINSNTNLLTYFSSENKNNKLNKNQIVLSFISNYAGFESEAYSVQITPKDKKVEKIMVELEEKNITTPSFKYKSFRLGGVLFEDMVFEMLSPKRVKNSAVFYLKKDKAGIVTKANFGLVSKGKEEKQKLLKAFIKNKKSPDKIFDLKKITSLIKTADKYKAYELLDINNLRFLYDSNTNKFEPFVQRRAFFYRKERALKTKEVFQSYLIKKILENEKFKQEFNKIYKG